jgi:hypothetical protein
MRRAIQPCGAEISDRMMIEVWAKKDLQDALCTQQESSTIQTVYARMSMLHMLDSLPAWAALSEF